MRLPVLRDRQQLVVGPRSLLDSAAPVSAIPAVIYCTAVLDLDLQ